MLSSRPSAELPSRDIDENSTTEAPNSGWSERRSFAPQARLELLPGEVNARWPAAWDDFRPSRLKLIDGDGPQVATATWAAPPLRPEDRALIVIPCLNEAGQIARVIRGVLEDEALVDPLVLVADGGSTDGSREIVSAIAAKDERVRLLANPGRWQSVGMNLAAQAMGEGRGWLVRLDAHSDYPANYVSTLIAEAQRTGAASVVVSMDTRGKRGFKRAVAAAQNSFLGAGGAAHRRPRPAGWVDHGHHALFRLDAFRALGGYDESFSHNEDAEFDLRLVRQGGRIWLTDKVRIGYHPRPTPRTLWRQYYSYGRGRARTVLKHRTPLKIRQALPLLVAPSLAAAAVAPLFPALALPALTWVALSLAYGLGLAARGRDAATAMAGPAAMIMHLAWSAGFWSQLFARGVPRRPLPEDRAGTAPAPVIP